MTLSRLKWLSVVMPALFIGIYEFFRHQFYHETNFLLANLITILIVGGGAYIFSRFIYFNIARLQRDMVLSNLELRTLTSIVQATSHSLNLPEVLKSIMEKVTETVPASSGAIYLVQNEQLSLSYQQRLAPGLIPATIDLKATGLQGLGAACQGTVIKAALTRLQSKQDHWIFLPLQNKGRVLGVLALGRQRPFDPWELNLLAIISLEIGFALDNARLHTQVQEMAVLEERNRIAKEVHDGLAQVLGLISLKTALVREKLDSNLRETTQAELREIEMIAQEAYTDAREAILGLRSSVSLNGGLVSSLKEYAGKFSRASGIQVELIAEAEKIPLAPAVEVQLLRIIQESLTNIRKHAQATKAWIRFQRDEGEARITVEDNGQGFDMASLLHKERPHYGLLTMKERAERAGGKFHIESQPGQGTKVVVSLPLLALERVG